jgi:hypothetical protein
MSFIQKKTIIINLILIVFFFYSISGRPKSNAVHAITSGVSAGQNITTPRIPAVQRYPADSFAKIKAEMNSGANADMTKKYQPALKRLLREADKLLKVEIHTVVEKTALPHSKDKHDYLSLSTYYWPDPAKPDGLPYLLRDGETNPEINTIQDKTNFEHMPEQSLVLALAYYYTGNETYAAKAVAILRAWFVNPETMMNPNLNFAQAVKGKNTGTKSGIIDARELVKLPEAMALLDDSPELMEQDKKAMQAWCAEFLDWLQTSKNGKEEGQALNNHGTWYDALAVALALYLDKKDMADSLLAKSLERIANQIEPDGRQQLELKRTKALSYSLFNLEAWLSLGFLSRTAGYVDPKTGKDLWNYQTSDGRSIKKALEWILPFAFSYVQAEKDAGPKFGYLQIKPVEKRDLYRLLAAVYALSGDKKYKELIQKLAVDGKFKPQEEPENLLYYGLAQ